MRPVLLVNGLPGSGKTTLAGPLAAELGLPLYSKDAYKEALWDERAHGGAARASGPSVTESTALGKAAVSAMWLDLGSRPGAAVVESFWFPPRDLDLITADLAAARGTPELELWCRVDPEVARVRCEQRARHAVHHSGHSDPLLWNEWAGNAGPLALGPVLEVDTSLPVDVAAVASACLQELEGMDLEGVLRTRELA